MTYDFAIVGGGIVGLSTALALTQRLPVSRIVLLENEANWAAHQTGHNSGVIHSGIYYKPGSLKAKLATQGARSMLDFCRTHNIPHQVCGKVMVATEPRELPLLDNICRRGVANGVKVARLDPEQLRAL